MQSPAPPPSRHAQAQGGESAAVAELDAELQALCAKIDAMNAELTKLICEASAPQSLAFYPPAPRCRVRLQHPAPRTPHPAPRTPQVHELFHPTWGQLLKAGQQNSKWAQQARLRPRRRRRAAASCRLVPTDAPPAARRARTPPAPPTRARSPRLLGVWRRRCRRTRACTRHT